MTADRNEAMSQHDRDSRELRELCAQRDAARATVRQQAERIAELENELADLHTTMFAAAVEIHEHWEAHCDAEGYGPANLMHRLERGIASQYGYDAKTLQRIEAERDQLRAEVERLRVERERWYTSFEHVSRILSGIHALMYPAPFTLSDGRTVVFRPKDPGPHEILQALSDRIRAIPDEVAAIAARTTHKDEG